MSQIWQSHISAAIYLVILAAMAVGGARYAASNYFVQHSIALSSLDQVENAALAEPWNPLAYEAKALILAKRNDFAGAAVALEKAVELRPHDYRLRLSLGDMWLRQGRSTSAERAYREAIDLAPHYGRPRVQLGMMYLGAGNRDKAFEFLGSAARLDPLYYPEVLHHAEAAFGGDGEAIERALAPTSKDGKTIFALYLIDRSRMTENTRAFLLGDELTSTEKNNLINHLKSKRNYRFAREVWLSKIGYDPDRFAEEPLFDGGFELMDAVDPSGLGWQIEQDSPVTTVSRDLRNAHSGTAALNIRFSGNAPLQHPVVSQLAFIDAGKEYRLTFYIRAGELTSGGLPAVLVSNVDTKAILAGSEPIEDSKGNWLQRSITFTAPDAGVVLLSIQRPGCVASPCPIFGEFSIDDISIVPVDR